MMKLNPEELSSGVLKPETLVSAVNEVRLNGYVIFESVIPHDLVDELNSTFLKHFHEQFNLSPDDTEVNTSQFRKNRARMFMPFEQPFIDPQVLTSPFIMPIVEEIIGKNCICTYLAVDAPLPGSDYQVVHSDAPPFYPEAPISMPPAALVLNIPLVDVTEENGPTEIWPGGTHLMPENLNKAEYIQEVAKLSEPVRVVIPKGSLLLRDLRMWHRGTPNNSNIIRPNLALIYSRTWWRGHYQDSLAIKQEVYDGLSDRAKELVRFEKLVDSATDTVRSSAVRGKENVSILTGENKTEKQS
jgi:ectoine hydroxylase-related dioxygenase (phytanoyl-CoA dioxygenase family)